MLRGLAREVEEARVAQACLRKEVLDQERLFGSERERRRGRSLSCQPAHSSSPRPTRDRQAGAAA